MLNKNHRGTYTKFYQVKKDGEFPWYGVTVNDKDFMYSKKGRKIKLKSNDILIFNGKYFNKLNKNSSVNIDIPFSALVQRNNFIRVEQEVYEDGYYCI